MIAIGRLSRRRGGIAGSRFHANRWGRNRQLQSGRATNAQAPRSDQKSGGIVENSGLLAIAFSDQPSGQSHS